MRKLLLSILILFTTLSAFAQGGIPLKTGQKYVTAIVDHGSGWVQVKRYPGNSMDGTLSYYQKSFVSFKVNGKVYTNNDVGLPSPQPANTFIMKDGVLSRIKGKKTPSTDTIRCVWPNKDGVDLIQEVYPVLFDQSEQIVIRWKVLNKGASSVNAAVQYLLDVQVGDATYTNDGAPILTRYGYRPNWDQFTPSSGNGAGIPPYYIAFQYPLPNSPTFDPGISGMGYTDNSYADLGLTKPTMQTIGNWPDMIQIRWGAPSPLPNGAYTDCATLFEFNPLTITPNKETLIAATSYGTGEFTMCKGQLFGLLFYPARINWVPPDLVPNPFTVEMHLFNPQAGGVIPQNTKLTLRVGDSLTILAPDTVKNNGKTQTQMIPPFVGVGVATWTVRASKSKECTEDLVSLLKFQAENSSISGPIFVDTASASDTCVHSIIIECANDDKLPPILEPIVVYQNGDKSIGAHDDRPVTDKGLRSIIWKPQAGTDSSNFLFSIAPALSGCSKDTHYVQIHQLDSTKGGCFDFVFEDCAGRESDTTVCFNAKYLPHIPDTIAPMVFNESILTSKLATFIMTDTNAIDTGILQISIMQPYFGSALAIVDPPLTPCSKLVHQVYFRRTDSLHSECIKFVVRDCAGNFTIDSVCFTGTLGVRSEMLNSVFSILGNPSSGRATIQLTLERAQDVSLRIVDALGRDVRRIDVKGLLQGENLIPLQTNELASGTYYVIVEIDGKQFTKSLKVVR